MIKVLKASYRDQCQVCNNVLHIGRGRGYSEGHHIRPLGKGGADVRENVLILCPNCHALFDLAAFSLSADGKSITGPEFSNRRITFRKGHKLGLKYVRYYSAEFTAISSR